MKRRWDARLTNGTAVWSLRAYFTEGIQRIVDEDIEAVVTLRMRGPGDVRLPPDTGIPLLERIIGDQRSIIGQVTGKDVPALPQVWTLYKEVQNWWDAGLRVPDDVTVVWCDDNWGNIRELPNLLDPPRSGGHGLYYHFDYVGGGRSYKWVDTNSLPNIWEQLSLAYAHGVDRVWMFNVGDLKNNELPLSFALSYAWDPQLLSSQQLHSWWWGMMTLIRRCGSRHGSICPSLLISARINSSRPTGWLPWKRATTIGLPVTDPSRGNASKTLVEPGTR